MWAPTGLALDAAGNLFIADSGDGYIQEVYQSTGQMSVVAGNGSWGYSGDGNAAQNAEFFWPTSIAIDSAGNLYMTDNWNDVIREIGGVAADIPTVSISSSNDSSVYGQNVMFTAIVNPPYLSGNRVSGTVDFYDGTTYLGSSAVFSDQATFSTSSLGAGMHEISARYDGDDYHAASTSAPLDPAVSPTTLYWDPNETRSENYGGSGIWSTNTGSRYWYDSATGTDVSWSDGCTAVLSGTAGTVTISGTVNPTAITLCSDYTIAHDSTSGGLSLSANGTPVAVEPEVEATVSAPLSGGLILSGGGALTVSGADQLSGISAITFTSTLNVANSMTIATGATLTNYGLLNIESSTLTNSGYLENDGTLTGDSTSVITNDGTLVNDSMLTSHWELYSPGKLVNDGELTATGQEMSVAGTFDNNGEVIVSTYFVLCGDGTLNNTATLTFQSDVTLNNEAALNNEAGGEMTIGGGQTTVESGALTDDGTLTNDGILDIEAADGLVDSGALVGSVLDNASIVFNVSSSQTITGVISGSGNVQVSGTGTVILAGSNTYRGTTTITAGLLGFVYGALPDGVGNVIIASGGSLEASGAYSTAYDWLQSNQINTDSSGALALTASDDNESDDSIDLSDYGSLSLGALGNIQYTGSITPGGGAYRLGGWTGR